MPGVTDCLRDPAGRPSPQDPDHDGAAGATVARVLELTLKRHPSGLRGDSSHGADSQEASNSGRHITGVAADVEWQP